MQPDIKHTWHFNQSPEEVWEYLTKPDLLEQWLMKSDFKPILGHKFSFFDKNEGDHFCEILEIKPVTKLSYSWKKPKMPFDSTVTWTLIPKDGGTDLQIVHNGFTVLKDYNDHNHGWDYLVTKLVERLNSGK
ncbi:MAG TPA: SRPBCC domain-containing protein [Ferruginibacter sp.]|jgi:uncharacterized protein YndB with AHSA1/START domain|nr:SRPBCC domain-containing protein [Ferruginibacter sp.]